MDEPLRKKTNFFILLSCCFYCLQRCFFCLEYRQTHIPVIFLAKIQIWKIAGFFYQTHGLTPLEKLPIFDQKTWTNPFRKIPVFDCIKLLFLKSKKPIFPSGLW